MYNFELCIEETFNIHELLEIVRLTPNTIYAYNLTIKSTELKIRERNFPTILNNKVLSRITVKILEKDAGLSKSLMKSLNIYDIVALEVSNDEEFKTALNAMPDLITFDCTDDLRLKHGYIREAINSGIYIEIKIRCGHDYQKRSNWLYNLYFILSLTKGKNIIISSGATKKIDIKNSQDIYSILNSYLSRKQSEIVLNKNPKNFLIRAASKRYTFNSVLFNDTNSGILKSFFMNIMKNFSAH
ncbi:hypothetical protein EDEG_00210 [Edhazardia aedis USNM 41457]|uniref:RNase P subunit p30 n=1 Tax=Edhazardia aedis (strain USNM 41457) TaxID=1003232 RepID=J9D680_EDHAE|nr:hypothetical protein EDEG_00210 [Edhazardia aedis USNM 41457]|eukprot:EJW03301.1 hypothetical protein EDEG_00210 [Edhazardia aedis USNM 41457]